MPDVLLFCVLGVAVAAAKRFKQSRKQIRRNATTVGDAQADGIGIAAIQMQCDRTFASAVAHGIAQ